MRARRPRPGARRETVAHEPVDVAGLAGVVREARGVRAARGQRREHRPVELPPPRSGERVLDRPPRQLMTKAHGPRLDGQQATGLAGDEPLHG